MAEAVASSSTKSHKKGKPLKSDEKWTVVIMFDKFSEKYPLLVIKILQKWQWNSQVLLYQIFAMHKERQDSSKLTTPGRRKKKEKSVLTCGTFVKTGIHSKSTFLWERTTYIRESAGTCEQGCWFATLKKSNSLQTSIRYRVQHSSKTEVESPYQCRW
jgi:hypothetical protein